MAEKKPQKKRMTWDEIDAETGTAYEPDSTFLQKARKSGDELVSKAFPSTEELQASKQGRRDTANQATDYLAGKGFPGLGAAVGTATDLSADMIPSSQEEYVNTMATSMGTASKGIGGLTMPKPTEAYRKAWNGLSHQERMATPFEEYLKREVAAEKVLQAQAQNSKQALTEAKPSKAGPSDVSDAYSKTKETFRPMQDDRVIQTSQKVVDVKSGAQPKASVVQKQEPVIQNAQFPEYVGPTNVTKKAEDLRKNPILSNETKSAIADLISKMPKRGN